MAEITASAVKALRDQTGLPMMDCKRALQESGGDPEAAIEHLRKAGKQTMEKRAGRETSAGRIAVRADMAGRLGTMVELQCESAPVASNEEFVQLAADLVGQLATGPGADSPEALLAQPSPSQSGKTLQEQLDDLTNRIREVFRVSRITRIDGPCGGYAHHNGAVGVLLEVEGGDESLAKDICMHIAAIRPVAVSRNDLDPALVEKERDIQRERARGEGKPDNIIEKMIEGRMKSFYADHCLLDQEFVKDSSKTVGKVAKEGGMTVKRFIHWELGKE